MHAGCVSQFHATSRQFDTSLLTPQEACVVLLDVGPQMGDLLEPAAKAVSAFIQGKASTCCLSLWNLEHVATALRNSIFACVRCGVGMKQHDCTWRLPGRSGDQLHVRIADDQQAYTRGAAGLLRHERSVNGCRHAYCMRVGILGVWKGQIWIAPQRLTRSLLSVSARHEQLPQPGDGGRWR